MVPQWILPVSLLLAAAAVTFFAWRSTRSTRTSSRHQSSAASAWQSEIDQEIADLKSTVDGLSSTLRKLRGRESMRARREEPSSDQQADHPERETERQRLRRLAGIVK